MWQPADDLANIVMLGNSFKAALGRRSHYLCADGGDVRYTRSVISSVWSEVALELQAPAAHHPEISSSALGRLISIGYIRKPCLHTEV